MKKIIVMMALMSLFSITMSAQDELAPAESSKKEIVYPKAGTFSIGVDATPYINFVGNMFNGTSNNSLNNVGYSTVYGKYFLDRKAAVRFELTVGNTKLNETAYVMDQSQNNLDPAIKVEDLRITKDKTFGLGLGYQEYMGDGRLRAFYGGQMLYTLSHLNYEYKWGNEMTVDNTAPLTSNLLPFGDTNSARSLTVDNGSSQSINLGAFVGVEYFVNSIIAIGGEAGLYASYMWDTQSDRTYETVEQGAHKEKVEAIAPTESAFTLRTRIYDTSMAAGRIYINFYF